MVEKRRDIQGIRGYAITMVVLYHFFPTYFPNGYVGVDGFFVISGFLIAMILTRDEKINASVVLNFYYKRIRRIMPLYYLVIIGVQLTLLSLLPINYLKMNLESCWKAITLTSNIKQQGDDQEYEKMLLGAEDLFTHTWSLSVEMQWYLLVPIVFLALRLVAKWEILVFLGVLSCSLAFYFYTDEMTAFHNVFARIWQFSCGVIAFLALEHKVFIVFLTFLFPKTLKVSS
ncbi:acyltransferase [Ancylostoma caninum]|uniref:Acyltransferase n=1 Tax=Ancylostoma caninum TaxID=29170 RepID=A0A368GWJ5_ANCCA|nr:acyltransferase [Ancylostoma caninum]